MNNKVCILGATGNIGIEVTVALLKNNEKVIAVVRNRKKLIQLLKLRNVIYKKENLTIIQSELFSKVLENDVINAIKQCDYVFNLASPKISWVPFSKINRKWGEPVCNLTRDIIKYSEQTEVKPHIIAMCGTEYFEKLDGKKAGLMSKILRMFIGALRDNFMEVEFLLNADYLKWTVFRCGSVREYAGTGVAGKASNIGMDLHKDYSNYKTGKGKALIAEDLGDYIADLINKNKMESLYKTMPFLFNTKF